MKKSKKGHAKDFGAVIYKLSDIFDYGITNFELTNNPARTVKIPPKPKVVKERIMVLHGEDLATWLNYLNTLPDTRANRRFNVICDTLLASGLRINEFLASTINDLDFDANEIIVNKTLMWKAGNKKLGIKGEIVCKNSAKTDAGNRRVAVPRQVLDDLKAFHAEMSDYFVSHDLPTVDLIFPTIYGNYMCDRNERATLKKRLTELGLPNYGFHPFRHTHASLMLNTGANMKLYPIKSITADNGNEFSSLSKIEGLDVYFAHAYSSYERGTNENFNGLLREFIPKGCSLKELNQNLLEDYTKAINERPRRIHGYQSAKKLFELTQTA